MHHQIPHLTDRQLRRFHDSYITASGGCWEWIGYRETKGYGCFRAGVRLRAHRVSYAIHHNRDPGPFMVCHSCDNRGCVNPAHLWLGNASDNNRDMHTKGRSKAGPYRLDFTVPCRRMVKSSPFLCVKCGHSRTDDYTHRNRFGREVRACRNCKTLRNRARSNSHLTADQREAA